METTNNNEGKEYTFSAEYKYVITDQVTVTANSEEEAREMALEQMHSMKVPMWKQLLESGFEPSVNEIEEKWVFETPAHLVPFMDQPMYGSNS